MPYAHFTLWDVSPARIFNASVGQQDGRCHIYIQINLSVHALHCHSVSNYSLFPLFFQRKLHTSPYPEVQPYPILLCYHSIIPITHPRPKMFFYFFLSDVLGTVWATFSNVELTSSANQKSSQQWCECLGQPSGIRDVWAGHWAASIHPFSTLHPLNSLTPYQAGLTIIWQSVTWYHIRNQTS